MGQVRALDYKLGWAGWARFLHKLALVGKDLFRYRLQCHTHPAHPAYPPWAFARLQLLPILSDNHPGLYGENYI